MLMSRATSSTGAQSLHPLRLNSTIAIKISNLSCQIAGVNLIIAVVVSNVPRNVGRTLIRRANVETGDKISCQCWDCTYDSYYFCNKESGMQVDGEGNSTESVLAIEPRQTSAL